MRQFQQPANKAWHSEFPSAHGVGSHHSDTPIQDMLKVLDTKINTIEDKLNLATAGLISIASRELEPLKVPTPTLPDQP